MNLTIIDTESHEPLLVLSEDDRGMHVAGGDPRMVQALKLQQFTNLKEVADYINSSDSAIQAIFGEEGENEENPDMDERIKPALEMIRALMTKVNERKNNEKIKEAQKAPETALVNTSESEIMLNPQDKIYVSVDGDNIGNAVARAEEMDDEDTLRDISDRINAGQDVMKEWAIRMGGYVVEQGGDEGVLKVPATAMKEIENLRSLYLQAVGATCSVGVGKKISESTKSRMLAKLKGKDRIVVFDPSVPQELELRLQDQNTTEANKLRTAMRPDQDMSQDHPERPRQIEPSGQAPATPPQEEKAPDDHRPQQTPEPKYSEKLAQARIVDVQQGKGKGKPQPKQETPYSEEKGDPEEKSLGGINRELVKHVMSHKPPKETGSEWGDSKIEEMDLSHHDDPEFAKVALYLAKHGGMKK